MTTPQQRPVYTRGQVYACLKRFWGYSALRPGQDDAVRAILQGRDSLVVLATGGGKSLCFQLPAATMKRLCVVVSPLIALMKDQVDGLTASGYPAAAMHSNIDPDELRRIEQGCRSGQINLLYVSAKRMASPRFRQMLHSSGLAAIIIDEAHCISQWGHDFVPEYRQLAGLGEAFPGASIHAFTATATPKVQRDIVQQLRLREPTVMVGSFDRPNLRYHIVRRATHEPDRTGRKFRTNMQADAPAAVEQIADILRARLGGPRGAAIVYCLKRADTEIFAAELTRRGIIARAYHAGLDAAERHDVQDAFVNEHLQVVVATVAFGMGIDRGDVRCVVHANAPKTIEAFQQETGRAGRDGLPAECHLLFDPDEDSDSWRFLIGRSAAAIDDPALSATVQREQLHLLDDLLAFASDSSTCRHRRLVEYFGQTYARRYCGACDVCDSAVRRAAHGELASMLIQGGAAAGGDPGALAEIVAGEATPRIVNAGLHTFEVFGALRCFSPAKIASMIEELAAVGALAVTGDARETPFDAASWRFKCLAASEARSGTRQTQRHQLDDHQQYLLDHLRMVRSRLAKRLGKSPSALFDESTLMALIVQLPTDRDGLVAVGGLSKAKIASFGDELLAALREGRPRP